MKSSTVKIDSYRLMLGGATLTLLALLVHRRRSAKGESVRESSSKNGVPSFSIAVVSEETVKADNHNDNEEFSAIREPISEVDEWLCLSSHWLQFCYRFDDALDVEKVRNGLIRTLAHIPALGARVRKDEKQMYEFVLSSESQGVVLEIAQGKVAVDSNESGNEAVPVLPDESSSKQAWLDAGLAPPPAGFNGEPGPNDPLMRAKLTIFEEEKVSYLSVGISHGLGDGHSVTDILQIWSHFCTSSSADGLPESLHRPRTFGRRVTEPMRPAKDLVELEKRVKKDVGCNVNPLSAWAFFGHVLPRAIWNMSRQQVFELRINRTKLTALKSAVMAELPEGEWVSRFEVLCATLIVAGRATAYSGEHYPGQHDLHVACDLRGRAKRFDTDYFGNGSFDFRSTMHLPPVSSWDLPTIVKVSQEVHKAIRGGLADPEEITRTKDWFEAARHLGLRNKYDVWPIIFDTLKNNGTFVNSWDSRWLQISMGSKSDARAFQAFFGVLQNIIVEIPRCKQSNDTTVHLALPPGHAKTFHQWCARNGDAKRTDELAIPFAVVA